VQVYVSLIEGENPEHEAWSRVFNALKKSDDEIKGMRNRKQQQFYERQNSLIDQFVTPFAKFSEEDANASDVRVKIAINASLAVNILLFCMQIVAAILSNSLALIATSVDSFMDLLSGFILFMTDRARHRPDPWKYPTGKSRFEAVGIVVFAALMSTVSVQLIIEGVETLIAGDTRHLDIGYISIILVAAAIGVKVLLFLYCRVLTFSPSAMTLAADHRNDIVVNSFGLAMALLGRYIVWWLDPSGALLVALIILRSWTFAAYEQIELLVGKSASPEFLQRLTYIAMSHHPEVLKVDTCRAFHVGANFYVEIDIVLPPEMQLIKTHDIGESLQIKLEQIPEVERAFVHIDFNFKHKPEHKLVI